MEKRTYIKPVLESETFVPQNYIATCGDTNNEYIFQCNAEGGILGAVFYDNGDGLFDPKVPIVNPNGKDACMGIGYHACQKTHITQKGDEFIDGWYVTGWNAIEGKGDVITPVIIWRGVEGNNIHCTTELDKNSWDVAKS